MKNLAQSFFLSSVFCLLFSVSELSASAATLSNDSFIIETKGVNLQPKTSSIITQPSIEPKPSPTPEPLPKPFSFSLSSTLVDFGQITPTDPITRTTTIHISPSDTLGFSLFALLDHELQAENKKIIPDTSCDNGLCNPSHASNWDSILTYGFGFRCESSTGFDCQSTFLDQTYYQPLPNQTKRHPLAPIIFGNTQKQEAQAIITYKTNISTTQEIGIYKNTLSLIAVPDF